MGDFSKQSWISLKTQPDICLKKRNETLKMPVRNGFLSNRALREYQSVTSPLYAARSVEEHVFRAWICDLHNTSTTYLAVLCTELIHSKAWSNKVKANTVHVCFSLNCEYINDFAELNSQHRAPCVRGNFFGRVVLRVGYLCMWAAGAIL